MYSTSSPVSICGKGAVSSPVANIFKRSPRDLKGVETPFAICIPNLVYNVIDFLMAIAITKATIMSVAKRKEASWLPSVTFTVNKLSNLV